MVARRLSGFVASAVCHALGLAVIISAGAQARVVLVRAQSPGDGQKPQMVIVDARDTDYRPDDPGIEADDDTSVVAIPGFTFNAAKIVRRGYALFPFLTGSVPLRAIAETKSHATPKRLSDPFARGVGGSERRPPLALSDTQLQTIVDKSWSRRERWRAFQPVVSLVRDYNPDEGALPALLRAYDTQDGLQPYAEAATRDPRLWSQLGVAADHTDFIAFIGEFVTQHPSTKAGTELLFLLDQLAQASYDTLVALLETDPQTQLGWTQKANRSAYDAVVTLRNHYLAQLEERGLSLGDSLKRYYEEARLSILETILQTTPRGYRANDARYLMGTIYWRQSRAAEAVQIWREIVVDPADAYATASSEILAAIGPARSATVEALPVIRALQRERSRWVSFSYERLHQFGYHFNTF